MGVGKGNMNLAEWIALEVKEGRAANKTMALRALEQRIKSTGGLVSFNTLSSVERGQKVRRYDKAEAIEKATNNAVSIAELCS